MSQTTSISAEIRENNISAKILRKSGEIPAIVYGQENDPKLVKVLEKDLVKILENPSIFSQVIELSQNDGAVKVILKEVQETPLMTDQSMSIFKPLVKRPTSQSMCL